MSVNVFGKRVKLYIASTVLVIITIALVITYIFTHTPEAIAMRESSKELIKVVEHAIELSNNAYSCVNGVIDDVKNHKVTDPDSFDASVERLHENVVAGTFAFEKSKDIRDSLSKTVGDDFIACQELIVLLDELEDHVNSYKLLEPNEYVDKYLQLHGKLVEYLSMKWNIEIDSR